MKAELVRGSTPQDADIHMGGDPDNPSWEDYLECWVEDYRPYIEGIRECIIREGIVGETADRMCNDHYFKAEDGRCIAFTWRAWGDLMSAVVDKKEGYMAYYM